MNAASEASSFPAGALRRQDRLARALVDADRQVRDEGERELLQAPEENLPALLEALALPGPTPPGALGRIALVVGALGARAGLKPLLRRGTDASVGHEDRAAIARAVSELLTGADAFDTDVMTGLERLSQDRDRTVRAYAAEAFSVVGDERSKARVRALADDKDPYVRARADRALARLAEAERDALAPDLTDFMRLAEEATAQGGRLKPWLDDLGDGRRAVRDAAIVKLVKAGDEALPFLLDKLNQPRPIPRIAAARALGLIRAPAAAGPLVIAATAPTTTPEERELRPVALRALANCLTGAEEGLAAALLPLARDSDRFVRAAALLCLGRVADRTGVREVVKNLTADDPFVVESAAIALSEGVREEDTELVPPLLDALDARAKRGLTALREAILIALTRIRVEEPALRVRVRHRVRHEVDGATAALRRAAIALVEHLHSEDDPPVLPVVDGVLARLDDEHPEVRIVAASFLAAHLPPGFTGAEERLTRALHRRERTLAVLCLEALVRLDTPGARDAVLAATRFDDPEVAARAAELAEVVRGETEEWRWSPRDARRPQNARGRAPARPAPPAALPGGRVRVILAADPATAEPAAEESALTDEETPKPSPKPTRDASPRADVVEAHFAESEDQDIDTDEGEPLSPAMSMPSGEMPAPEEDDDGPLLPPPSGNGQAG